MLTMLKVRMSIIVDAEKSNATEQKNVHLRYLFGTFAVCLLFAPLRFSSIIECVILSFQN